MQDGIINTYQYIIDEMTDIYNFIFWMVLVATTMADIVNHISTKSLETVNKLLRGIEFLQKRSVKVGMLNKDHESKLNELTIKLTAVVSNFKSISDHVSVSVSPPAGTGVRVLT